MPSLLQRLARLAPYYRPSYPGMLAAFVAAAVGAATEPAIPALMKPLLDRGFVGSERGFALWYVPVAIVGLFIIRGLAAFVGEYALDWANGKSVLRLREAMFERLLDAHPTLFSRYSASGLTNALVHEVQAGTNALVGALMTLVRDSLTVVALFGYLLWLNWRLTVFVVLLAPAFAIVTRAVAKRLRKLAIAGRTTTEDLSYVVEENVLAWRIVRLHDAQAAQRERFAGQAGRLRRLVLKAAAAGAVSSPITQLLAALALSAVITMALWQGERGATVGGFVAFVTAMLMMTPPLKNLAKVAGPLTRGLVALEHSVALIEDTPAERSGGYRPPAAASGSEGRDDHAVRDHGRARGDILFEAVSLRYRDEQAAPALDGIDLAVPAGQTLALVGPSGAGKTTLVNLLPRFIEPSAGRVLLDGVPLADWDIRALRRQFALVSQDVVLFNGSIADNVALASADGDEAAKPPDRARIETALRDANLWSHIETLPQGIDAPVGHNGSELSGGQRQRLAIARALYKDAPILLLDEATSALDSASERAVQDALQRLMQGRTTLVIAHRLSTIEHADRVVAMAQGRIVEQGTPAQLQAAGGLYARLRALQFRS